MPKLLTLLLFASSPLFGWWCEGHEVVALIAGKHLTANARTAISRLLNNYRPDPPQHFCKENSTDPMAVASTWADDIRKEDRTGRWHYMDIPLGLKKGDPEAYCEPIGPSLNGGDRPGCILSALRSSVNILQSDKESEDEKARALRFLIHLVGDLHQPLHTTSNNDQGGNCTSVQFLSNPKITNLHSVWDGMIVNEDLATSRRALAQMAADLDQQYESKSARWIEQGPRFAKWAWEGHLLAQKLVYGQLEPKLPVEPDPPRLNCKVEAEASGTPRVRIGPAYVSTATRVIEEQLAKAGYRLAEILNDIWS